MNKFNVIAFYLVFAAATTVGLFLSSLFISPYLLGHVFPLIPVNARINHIQVIMMLSLTSAIPAGVVFGFAFGLWISVRPGYKAFWLGLCASILLVLYTGFSLWGAGVMPGQFYWWTQVSEMVFSVSFFVLAAVGASRLAFHVNARKRKVVGAAILLAFFAAFALA